MKLKVCGINEADFAVEAARSGVDYLGFIFHPDSPRAVTVPEVVVIVGALASRSSAAAIKRPQLVGVFVRQSAAEIVNIMKAAGLDIVQLHRRATPEDVAYLQQAGFEVWTLAGGAIGDGVLFDSSHGDGDTVFVKGEAKTILAGRLGVADLTRVRALGCDIMDVNSSLETSPGHKSVVLLSDFITHFTS